MTPDKWPLIDVRLHNRCHSLTDMCENVQIYVGEHTYAVSVGYFLILSSPIKTSTTFYQKSYYIYRKSNHHVISRVFRRNEFILNMFNMNLNKFNMNFSHSIIHISRNYAIPTLILHTFKKGVALSILIYKKCCFSNFVQQRIL